MNHESTTEISNSPAQLTTTEAPTVIHEHVIEDSSATVISEPPFLFTTADAPIVRIPRPPIAVPFNDHSCHWIERFHLCYAIDSRYCVIAYGGRPENGCVLAQISDDVPQAT